MLHIYYGLGKGKTTAAVGSAIRAAGRDMKVFFVQLFKSENSGERRILATLPQVELTPCPKSLKFTFDMTEKELQDEKARYLELLKKIKKSYNDYDLIVIDEFFTLIDCGLIDTDTLQNLISPIYNEKELILTGHKVDDVFLSISDYATEFKCKAHPYSNGTPPRKGIEF